MLGRVVGIMLAAAGMAGAARAEVVQFLATDGDRLYRGDSTGAVQPFVTLSAALQSLTYVPEGFTLPGAAAGDIIACAVTASGGRYSVYRVDDPAGTPTLTPIGSTTVGIGSLVFAGGKVYGVEDSLNPVRVYELDATTWANVQSWSTGLAVGGCGGMAYDPEAGRFLITDATNHRLMSWLPGQTATAIGPVGFGFSNNGLEFLNGTLYGALRRDTPSTQMSLGYFDLATGGFTTQATLTGIRGSGTGFITIPAPGGVGVIVLAAIRRSRRAS